MMINKKIIYIFFIILQSTAYAKEVKMLFTANMPPYVIIENNSGYELEIIRAALQYKGHILKPVYAPISQLDTLLKNKKIDASERGNHTLKNNIKVYYAPIKSVQFNDVAISLEKNKFNINKISDLKNKSIIAFDGAKFYLGPEYAEVVKYNKQYIESANQKLQPLMIYTNKIDVSVGDINIFKYFSKKLPKSVNIIQPIDVKHIFSENDNIYNHEMFVDKKVMKDFADGLSEIKKNGTYQKIIEKYNQ